MSNLKNSFKIFSEKIKIKLFKIAEFLHRKIFGSEMSDEMRKFLGNLSWSFLGGMLAAGLMFILNIIAGRWLGPEEYGKYNLVFLMAQFLLIPMLLGMDLSVLRKIAQTENSNKQKDFISSSVLFVLITSLFSIVVIVLFRNFLAEVFSAETNLVIIATFFSFSLVLKMIFDGIIKGFCFFKLQAIVKIFEAILAVALFFILFLFFKNYLQLALAVIVASLFVSFVFFIKLKKFFGKPNLKSIKKLLNYSKFVVTGSLISIVLVYGDRFVINKYFGAEELGLYSAYYTATIFVVGQFISIITNVFFAMIAKVKEKKLILIKIDKMLGIGIIPMTLLMSLIGFFVLKLFGSSYQINFLILFLFGFISALQFFVSFYANMVNVHSKKTYFWGLILFSLRALLYLAYIIALIFFGKITIPAILMGLVFNYIFDIINLRYIIKKYA